MPNKKYASLSTLQEFLAKLRETFSSLGHKHAISDITDYKVDTTLSPTSNNPIANKAVNEEFESIGEAITVLDTILENKSNTSHDHDDKYDTKGAAADALGSAKTYTESYVATAVSEAKNDLLNGAGAAYDTLKELGDLINENTNALEALETVATNKLDKNTFAEHLTATELTLSSANGKKFKITIDDTGTLTVTEEVE